ncbi:ABC transporter ATP-binding protein [Paenibacillus beijingensis]|uniref:Multidrug ABC transporter permease n=1 Tax=Paenibacillus beijingensis TaxID=1126833 RepID=A0A0D5NHF7_9BACL|nr:ABC transporter ATP-binding protein [Paenibacillus beijingensis]AJY74686.1 multidrug ABC transporter permease [Paenibacillus beijingensis]
MGLTGKKLFQYALIFKRPILFALLLLALAVSTELLGPYIAKTMIDQNIEGIEKGWREVPANGPNAVYYDGKWYKRADRIAPGDRPGASASVLQVGRSYYWLSGTLPLDGKREVEGGKLTITAADGQTAEYTVKPLSRSEVYGFYKPEIPRLLMMAGAYFALLALAACFTYGQRLLLQTSANRIVQRMREDVFAHIQRLPVGYFDNLPAGKVVSRVTNDTEAVRELFVAVLANFFAGIIYIAATMGALFLLDTKLALIALPLLPLLVVWIVVYRRFAGKYNTVIRSKLSDINAMINESIQGMPIIQAFRRQKSTAKEFDELNEEFFSYQSKLLSLNSLTSHNLVNVIRNIIFIIVLWMFWGDSLEAVVSVGVLYAFIEYMNRMFQPIVGIVNQLANLETARVSAGRVFELLDQPGTDVTSGTMPRYRGEVAFENVSFAYNNNDYVLRDISFHARQGETVALVGHTGSGKSSVLNLLFRFYDIEEGRITVDGKDIRDIPKQLLRQHMGIVLQDPFLFTGTIASNISLDTPGMTRERIEQALRDVGAYDMFMALPGGLDHPVIEKGSTLSAGQRQLISFARALAHDPAILILDEATASIDTETEAVIQAALDVLKKGRTTFVIAHRLSTIRAADQILVLDRGRIVESGNHDTLMLRGGKYYAMYQLQSGVSPSPSGSGSGSATAPIPVPSTT